MNRVFIENIQIRPDIFPVLFAPRRLQNISKLAFRTETVHNINIMFNPKKHKGTDNLVTVLNHNILWFFRCRRISAEICVHTQGPHIFFKFMKSCVNHTITIALGFIHIIKLG